MSSRFKSHVLKALVSQREVNQALMDTNASLGRSIDALMKLNDLQNARIALLEHLCEKLA